MTFIRRATRFKGRLARFLLESSDVLAALKNEKP